MESDYKKFLSEGLFELLEQYVPDFFYIADYAGGRYIHVSESVIDCLGYSAKRFCDNDGAAFTLSLLHPDDLQATLDTFTRYEHSEFVGTIPSVTMEYRLRHFEGHYVWVRSRDYIIEFTEAGKIKTTLGMVLLIDQTRSKEESIFTNADIQEIAKNTYTKYQERKKELDKLSYREFQVIGLLAQGLPSKEIAVKLEISEDTVETHRRNILKKLGLKNTVQTINLISKYRRLH